MSRTTCPDCGKGILGVRRYHPDALASTLGVSLNAACVAAGVSGTTQQDARCHGFTRELADRVAVTLGYHPYEVWPDMADHDLEDATVACLECGNRFVPTRKGHVYCTYACGRRRRERDRRRERWATDPEWRAKCLAANAARYQAEKNYRARYGAARYRQNREARLAYQKAYYERNRQARIEYARTRRAEQRDEAA